MDEPLEFEGISYNSEWNELRTNLEWTKKNTSIGLLYNTHNVLIFFWYIDSCRPS